MSKPTSPYYLGFEFNGAKLYKDLQNIRRFLLILGLLAHHKRGKNRKYKIEAVTSRAITQCTGISHSRGGGVSTLYFLTLVKWVKLIPYRSRFQELPITELYVITPKGEKAYNMIMLNLSEKLPVKYNEIVNDIGKGCNKFMKYYENKIAHQKNSTISDLRNNFRKR
jgi:hypothetical protein